MTFSTKRGHRDSANHAFVPWPVLMSGIGIVAVCCAELARFSSFSECLANLEKPPGTEVLYRTGMNVALNRKSIASYAVDNDYEWVWFVDDDMLFEPFHLMRLLDHNLPVVASLYMNRNPPFYAMAFNDMKVLQDGKPAWRAVSLKGAPETGLADVVAAGTGGLLVRTEVLRAIPYGTWFDHEEGTEDLPFCWRVTTAGYKIYLDMGAIMGHISTYSVWPSFIQGQWEASVQLTDKHAVILEIEK